MPWRDEPTFYHVLVSELMLQQTQVSRVLVKFDEFMQVFSTIDDLAAAPLADVLRVWSGLGYNRRAKYLHEAAKQICSNTAQQTQLFSNNACIAHNYSQKAASAVQPRNTTLFCALTDLPGVGKNTAAAIMNYVYEIPTPFVETNIRTVYFTHFFAGQQAVTDKEVLAMVEQTMDGEHPREWFWALMDYGAWLKSQGDAKLDVSKHYKKQSSLRGSVREVRGQIIRTLGSGQRSVTELESELKTDDRFDRALQGLLNDGLIEISNGVAHLTGAKN